MKREYTISLKVDSEKDFGLGIGILATKTIEFDLEPEEYDTTRFKTTLLNQRDKFLNESIRTSIERVV